MTRRKKKKVHDDHIDETWLLPYSDLLTLLVALFIVLFASGSIDAGKLAAMANAFNAEFKGGTGILDYPSPIPNGGMETTENDQEQATEDPSYERPEQTQEQYKEQQSLGVIQNRVNNYIQENGLQNQLGTSLTANGLLVTIRDSVLFDSGRAEIRPENITVVTEISKLLVMDAPRSIVVSGHTDNVPIHNSNFRSNWDLSVMRALNFMRILLENDQLNPELFSAKGHGEFQPVASNDTLEGRAQNRRVEILIEPNTD